jgi:hypothetical protein
MRLSPPVVALSAAFALSAFVARPAVRLHDPCKVLTAEVFGRIMGYTATIDKIASTATNCVYTGPAGGGGQFMIFTEVAGATQADAMLKRPGATPPAGSGLVGGMYREGTIVFSVSIRSTDQAKLQAVVAAIRRNLA